MVHHFSATADAGGVAIQAEQSGNWPLPYAEIAIALPASERRPLTLRSDRIPLRPPAAGRRDQHRRRVGRAGAVLG